MFQEELWNDWVQQELSNYKVIRGKKVYLKKGYMHFDNRFWFPERNEEIKKIIQNGLRIYRKESKRMEKWSFTPFLKILIKTPRYKYQEEQEKHDLETKIRPISFASHIDALIYSYYSYSLTKIYEKYIKRNRFDESILAYRSDLGKCNIQFAKEVFREVELKGECTAVCLDIKGYFDNIDHVTLLEKWQKLVGGKLPDDQFRIYKSLTRYNYVNKNSLVKKFKGKRVRNEKLHGNFLDLFTAKKDSEKFQILRDHKLIVTNDKPNINTNRFVGIPQGSPLSSLLSNIYLIDFDNEMYLKSMEENFIYRRYCDDIIIVCSTNKSNEIRNYIIEKISNEPYLLTIQDKKVETIDFKYNSKKQIRSFKRDKKRPNNIIKTNNLNETKFYKSLQYLGFEFNGQNIYIRTSSLSRYFKKMRARIIKTISMAYGSSGISHKIFLRQIFERYSHLGERNFIKYAINSSQEYYINGKGEKKEGMNSIAIKKQVSRHMSILKNALQNKNEQRFLYKGKRRKVVIKKTIT
jgi:hypothetical protein